MWDNPDFYPTPPKLIKHVLSPYVQDIKLGRAHILEPSAGSGAFLQAIKILKYEKTENLYCCENDPDLAMLLQEKGFSLIDYDFLKMSKSFYVNLIVMNPPFSNGAKHFLKAWEMLDEGNIACILNAETIRNPFSQDRKNVLRIIEKNGSVQFIKNAFNNSESVRKTDVEIALIRVNKKNSSDFDIDFGSYGREADTEKFSFDENFGAGTLAKIDVFQNIVDCYNTCKKIKVEQLQINQKMSFFRTPIVVTKNVVETKDKEGVVVSKRDTNAYVYNKANSIKEYNEFVTDLKKSVWDKIFRETKFKEIITESLRKKIEKQFAVQMVLDITIKNIEDLFETLFQNRESIMKECLLETFDLLCSFDAKNKLVTGTGYKTNDSYKVNKKVIVPWVIDYNKSLNYYSLYERSRKLDDIDKSLCFLTGKKFESIIQSRDTLYKHISGSIRKPFIEKRVISEFFQIDFFKVNTIHITFLDEQVHRLFNAFVAKERGWLAEENTNKSYANGRAKTKVA